MTDQTGDSAVKKRSVIVNGHATSIALEGAFWQELQKHAKLRGISMNRLVSEIDSARPGPNLSSAIRIYILQAVQQDRDQT